MALDFLPSAKLIKLHNLLEKKSGIDFWVHFKESLYMSNYSHADWTATKNLAGLSDGLVRSILGYAGESLVIGRALACGYNLFFKAWRDSKYDAVLDARGQLFRVEIKQTGDGTKLSCTSGGRSGAQISRQADSREEVLSPEDSDFLIGVHTFSGTCWVVPTEVVFFRNRSTLNTNSLEPYKEKWKIFSKPPFGLDLEIIRKGFRNLDQAELESLGSQVGLSKPENLAYSFSPSSREIELHSLRDWYVLEIWRTIFEAI